MCLSKSLASILFTAAIICIRRRIHSIISETVFFSQLFVLNRHRASLLPLIESSMICCYFVFSSMAPFLALSSCWSMVAGWLETEMSFIMDVLENLVQSLHEEDALFIVCILFILLNQGDNKRGKPKQGRKLKYF